MSNRAIAGALESLAAVLERSQQSRDNKDKKRAVQDRPPDSGKARSEKQGARRFKQYLGSKNTSSIRDDEARAKNNKLKKDPSTMAPTKHGMAMRSLSGVKVGKYMTRQLIKRTPTEAVEAQDESTDIASEIVIALDEAGYDVKGVETMEDLISDVEKFMTSNDLDEGLMGKLKAGITRAKKFVGKTFQTAAHKDRLTKLSNRQSNITANKQAKQFKATGKPSTSAFLANPVRDAEAAARRRADSNSKVTDAADAKKRRDAGDRAASHAADVKKNSYDRLS